MKRKFCHVNNSPQQNTFDEPEQKYSNLSMTSVRMTQKSCVSNLGETNDSNMVERFISNEQNQERLIESTSGQSANLTSLDTLKTALPSTSIASTFNCGINISPRKKNLLLQSPHGQSADPTVSKMIKQILMSPSTKSLQNVCSVSKTVNNIVSKVKSGEKSQKYIVMPIFQSSMVRNEFKNPTRYIVVDIQKPCIQPHNLPPRFKIHSNAETCQWMSSLSMYCAATNPTVVDAVKKWLDCNRNNLSRNLLIVAESLELHHTVCQLINVYSNFQIEYRVFKWIGVTLLLLVKKTLLDSSDIQEEPIYNHLQTMWNTLRDFFNSFEQCLLLVMQHRKKDKSNNKLNELFIEDSVYEAITTLLITTYNSITRSCIPIPADRKNFTDFLVLLSNEDMIT